MKRLVALALLALIGHQFSRAMNGNSNDYYALLGISKTATSAEIRKAYRKRALQYHPDKNKSADAEDMFKKIGQAYEILGNDTTRRQYDAGETIIPDIPRQEGEKPFSPENAFDIFASHKSYPTDAVGIKNLYDKLLKGSRDLLWAQKVDWGYIEDFCNDVELAHLKQDPEIKQMCDICPLIIRLNNFEKLSATDKEQINNDPKVKKYYTEMQTAVVDSVNADLACAKSKNLVPEYERLIKILSPFTPATSAKILNIFSEVITYYTQQREFANAEQVAQKAQRKSDTLAVEIKYDLKQTLPKFNQAQSNLNEIIDTIAKCKRRAAQEKAEQEEKQAMDTIKAQEEAELQKIQDQYEQIKKDLSSGDLSYFTHAVASIKNLADQAKNRNAYLIARNALQLLKDWINENSKTSNTAIQIRVQLANDEIKKIEATLMFKKATLR